jgi:hypothetical protein
MKIVEIAILYHFQKDYKGFFSIDFAGKGWQL